eukprot:580915-Pyramimonas_sp.AAC.1
MGYRWTLEGLDSMTEIRTEIRYFGNRLFTIILGLDFDVRRLCRWPRTPVHEERERETVVRRRTSSWTWTSSAAVAGGGGVCLRAGRKEGDPGRG